MRNRWLILLLLALFAAPLLAQDTATPEPLHERGIAYVPDGHTSQQLEITLPQADIDPDAAPYPTVLLFHGSHNSLSTMFPQRDHLVELGYAVVNIDYRETGIIANTFADAFCALGWVHANAEAYHLDAEHIAALGYSLGGWVVGLLGTVDDGSTFLQDECPYTLPEDSRVQGVIGYAAALFSPMDLLASQRINDPEVVARAEQLAEIPPSTWLSLPGLPEAVRSALINVVTVHLDEHDAPFLLIHSTNDNVVPVEVATSFAEAVEDVGGSVEVVLQDDGGHGIILFRSRYAEEASAAAEEFLAAVLTPPAD